MKIRHLLVSFVLGLGLALTLLWCLGDSSAVTLAASRTEPTLELHVCPSGCDYLSVQAAVDAASDGDIIKVASGTYSGVNSRNGVTQVVYISKTVTIRGGYTIADWNTSNPMSYPTTLDAQGQGRVFYITRNVAPSIEGLRITNGNATRSSGGYDTGGGVFVVNGARATLTGTQVFSNTADHGGGISVVSATATIVNNLVFGNTAARGSGGGVYLYDSTTTLTGNTIATNTALDDGGGLYAGRCLFYCSYASDSPKFDANASTVNLGLYGNTFVANRAVYEGGGLYLGEPHAMLSNNIIVSNTADYGGGLFARFGGGTFTNTVVTDNRSDVAGSGLYFVGSWSRLLHTTVARNHGGDSSGICISWYGTGSVLVPNRITLTNSIVASQTVGITMTGYYTEPWGDAATLDGVLWFGNEANTGGTWTITISHAYTGNPALAADGYHLTIGSAAIDKGVSVGVVADIDGEPRPPNAGSDLGADEFPAALVVIKQANPTTVEGGEQLTYTIRITNTGSGDLHAIITDTLPDHIASGHTSGGTAVVPGGQITWTAVITAPGGVWTETAIVTVALDHKGPLTNLVEVTTEEGAIGKAQVVVNLFRVYLPLVMRDYHVRCETHTAALTLSASATTLQVNDTVTVTTALINQGCVALGEPQYRLLIQSDQIDPIFDPGSPEPVVHYLAVAPGQSDTVDFVLQAIAPGQATLNGSASFEVHLGYPGPAYWGFAVTDPLAINVTP